MAEIVSAGEPIQVLLIDDEKGFVDILAKRLAKRNIMVTQSFSGQEGIRALRKNDFDLVLLDLKMEDMDGLEVLKIIKIMAPEIPVVMLSGHASNDAADRGIEAGAFEYLTKPYELSELVEKITQAVRANRSSKPI